jgi:hypothetical protein
MGWQKETRPLKVWSSVVNLMTCKYNLDDPLLRISGLWILTGAQMLVLEGDVLMKH